MRTQTAKCNECAGRPISDVGAVFTAVATSDSQERQNQADFSECTDFPNFQEDVHVFTRPGFLIPAAIVVCCCCFCVRSKGQPASQVRPIPASEQHRPIRPADVQIVGTGIAAISSAAVELKGWEPSNSHRSASVVEHSLDPTEPNRRPTDVLLVARRETKRDYSNVTAADRWQATGKQLVPNAMPNMNSQSRSSIDPQELEQIERFLIEDALNPQDVSDDDNDQTATQGISAKRADFRESLRRPLPTDPIQLALLYVDDDGKPVPDSEFRHTILTQFAGFNSRPFGDGYCRLDACDCCWHAKYYVWKSPDLCYGPLYFEEVNLERFGGRFPIMQPAISAVHFVGNTIRLPYSMGLQSPHHCYYSAGYGRPGNQYCYQCERPVWSLKAGTFQALLVTGLVFGLP